MALRLHLRVGISVYPDDGDGADTLLRNAGAAVRQAKQDGRHGFRFYRDSMNAASLRRLSIRGRLPAAMASGALCLYYQPIRDVASGRVSALEVLLRWQDDELGAVSPG
jgi:predicted signal transduction protein with EAL and GGDEF domain